MQVRDHKIIPLHAEIKRTCQHRILYPPLKNVLNKKEQNKNGFRKQKSREFFAIRITPQEMLMKIPWKNKKDYIWKLRFLQRNEKHKT